MPPQGPQIAKIVYYLTLWVIYEKLVVHCFPWYSYICFVTRSSLADTYKWILQNGLPWHPKHECYILHVYLYLYKTRIDGTINCKLVYMVTTVTYKLRGTMIGHDSMWWYNKLKNWLFIVLWVVANTTNAILYRARERQEACRPDSSDIYNWFSGHKQIPKVSSNIAQNHSYGLKKVISGHHFPKFTWKVDQNQK